MASVRLQPPDSFDFQAPDEWTKWKRRFENFRSASGLSGEDEPRQVSTLLYCMGQEADDVLTSTNITEAERRSYGSVMAKLDGHFQVRRNVIFERAIAETSSPESLPSSTLRRSTAWWKPATTATSRMRCYATVS